jgi:hypothetical protein
MGICLHGPHTRAVTGRRTLGLPTFPCVLLKGVTGLEGEKTRSLPSIFLVEEQDKEQVMVGKERQV